MTRQEFLQKMNEAWRECAKGECDKCPYNADRKEMHKCLFNRSLDKFFEKEGEN